MKTSGKGAKSPQKNRGVGHQPCRGRPSIKKKTDKDKFVVATSNLRPVKAKKSSICAEDGGKNISGSKIDLPCLVLSSISQDAGGTEDSKKEGKSLLSSNKEGKSLLSSKKESKSLLSSKKESKSLLSSKKESKSLLSSKKEGKSLPSSSNRVVGRPLCKSRRSIKKKATKIKFVVATSNLVKGKKLKKITEDGEKNVSDSKIASHSLDPDKITQYAERSEDVQKEGKRLPSSSRVELDLKGGDAGSKINISEETIACNQESLKDETCGSLENPKNILQKANALNGSKLQRIPVLSLTLEIVFAAVNCGMFSDTQVYNWIQTIYGKKHWAVCTKMHQDQFRGLEALNKHILQMKESNMWKSILSSTPYHHPKCNEVCRLFKLKDLFKDEIVQFYKKVFCHDLSYQEQITCGQDSSKKKCVSKVYKATSSVKLTRSETEECDPSVDISYDSKNQLFSSVSSNCPDVQTPVLFSSKGLKHKKVQTVGTHSSKRTACKKTQTNKILPLSKSVSREVQTVTSLLACKEVQTSEPFKSNATTNKEIQTVEYAVSPSPQRISAVMQPGATLNLDQVNDDSIVSSEWGHIDHGDRSSLQKYPENAELCNVFERLCGYADIENRGKGSSSSEKKVVDKVELKLTLQFKSILENLYQILKCKKPLLKDLHNMLQIFYKDLRSLELSACPQLIELQERNGEIRTKVSQSLDLSESEKTSKIVQLSNSRIKDLEEEMSSLQINSALKEKQLREQISILLSRLAHQTVQNEHNRNILSSDVRETANVNVGVNVAKPASSLKTLGSLVPVTPISRSMTSPASRMTVPSNTNSCVTSSAFREPVPSIPGKCIASRTPPVFGCNVSDPVAVSSVAMDEHSALQASAENCLRKMHPVESLILPLPTFSDSMVISSSQCVSVDVCRASGVPSVLQPQYDICQDRHLCGKEAMLLSAISEQNHKLDQGRNASKLQESLVTEMCRDLKDCRKKIHQQERELYLLRERVEVLEEALEHEEFRTCSLQRRLSESVTFKRRLDFWLTSDKKACHQSYSVDHQGELSMHLQELEERLAICSDTIANKKKTIQRLEKDLATSNFAVLNLQETNEKLISSLKVKESDAALHSKEPDDRDDNIKELNERIVALEKEVERKVLLHRNQEEESLYLTGVVLELHENLQIFESLQPQVSEDGHVNNDRDKIEGSEEGTKSKGYGRSPRKKNQYDPELMILLKEKRDDFLNLIPILRELDTRFRNNLPLDKSAIDHLDTDLLIADVSLMIFSCLELNEDLKSFLRRELHPTDDGIADQSMQMNYESHLYRQASKEAQDHRLSYSHSDSIPQESEGKARHFLSMCENKPSETSDVSEMIDDKYSKLQCFPSVSNIKVTERCCTKLSSHMTSDHCFDTHSVCHLSVLGHCPPVCKEIKTDADSSRKEIMLRKCRIVLHSPRDGDDSAKTKHFSSEMCKTKNFSSEMCASSMSSKSSETHMELKLSLDKELSSLQTSLDAEDMKKNVKELARGMVLENEKICFVSNSSCGEIRSELKSCKNTVTCFVTTDSNTSTTISSVVSRESDLRKAKGVMVSNFLTSNDETNWKTTHNSPLNVSSFGNPLSPREIVSIEQRYSSLGTKDQSNLQRNKVVFESESSTDAVDDKASRSVPRCKSSTDAVDDKASRSVPRCKSSTNAVDGKASRSVPQCESSTNAVDDKASRSVPRCKSSTNAVNDKASRSVPQCESSKIAVDSKTSKSVPQCESSKNALDDKASRSVPRCKSSTNAVNDKASRSVPQCESSKNAVDNKASRSVPQCDQHRDKLSDITSNDLLQELTKLSTTKAQSSYTPELSNEEVVTKFDSIPLEIHKVSCTVLQKLTNNSEYSDKESTYQDQLTSLKISSNAKMNLIDSKLKTKHDSGGKSRKSDPSLPDKYTPIRAQTDDERHQYMSKGKGDPSFSSLSLPHVRSHSVPRSQTDDEHHMYMHRGNGELGYSSSTLAHVRNYPFPGSQTDDEQYMYMRRSKGELGYSPSSLLHVRNYPFPGSRTDDEHMYIHRGEGGLGCSSSSLTHVRNYTFPGSRTDDEHHMYMRRGKGELGCFSSSLPHLRNYSFPGSRTDDKRLLYMHRGKGELGYSPSSGPHLRNYPFPGSRIDNEHHLYMRRGEPNYSSLSLPHVRNHPFPVSDVAVVASSSKYEYGKSEGHLSERGVKRKGEESKKKYHTKKDEKRKAPSMKPEKSIETSYTCKRKREDSNDRARKKSSKKSREEVFRSSENADRGEKYCSRDPTLTKEESKTKPQKTTTTKGSSRNSIISVIVARLWRRNYMLEKENKEMQNKSFTESVFSSKVNELGIDIVNLKKEIEQQVNTISDKGNCIRNLLQENIEIESELTLIISEILQAFSTLKEKYIDAREMKNETGGKQLENITEKMMEEKGNHGSLNELIEIDMASKNVTEPHGPQEDTIKCTQALNECFSQVCSKDSVQSNCIGQKDTEKTMIDCMETVEQELGQNRSITAHLHTEKQELEENRKEIGYLDMERQVLDESMQNINKIDVEASNLENSSQVLENSVHSNDKSKRMKLDHAMARVKSLFMIVKDSIRREMELKEVNSTMNAENVNLQTALNFSAGEKRMLNEALEKINKEKDECENITLSLNKDKEACQKVIDSLNKEKDTLLKVSRDLKFQVSKLEESRTSLNSDKLKLYNENIELQETTNNLMSEKGELETNLESMIINKDVLSGKLEAAVTNLELEKVESCELQKQLETYKGRLIEAETCEGKLLEDLKKKTQLITEHSLAIDLCREKLMKKEVMLSELQNSYQEKESTNVELLQTIQKKDEDIVDLQKNMDMNENLIEELHKNIQKKENLIIDLRKDIQNKKTMIAELAKSRETLIEKEAVLAELQNNNQQKESSIMELNETIQKRESSIMELKKTLQKKDGIIVDLMNNIKKKENLIVDLPKDIRKKENLIVGFQKDIQNKENLIGDLQKDLQKKNNLIGDLQKNIQKKNDLIGDLQKDIQKKENLIVELRHNIQKEENFIVDLQKDIQDVYSQNVALENDKQQLIHSVKSLEEEKICLKSKISELETNQRKEVATAGKKLELERKLVLIEELNYTIGSLKVENQRLEEKLMIQESMYLELEMEKEQLRKLKRDGESNSIPGGGQRMRDLKGEVCVLGKQLEELSKYNLTLIDQLTHLNEFRVKIREVLHINTLQRLSSIPTSEDIECIKQLLDSHELQAQRVESLKVSLLEEQARNESLGTLILKEQHKVKDMERKQKLNINTEIESLDVTIIEENPLLVLSTQRQGEVQEKETSQKLLGTSVTYSVYSEEELQAKTKCAETAVLAEQQKCDSLAHLLQDEVTKNDLIIKSHDELQAKYLALLGEFNESRRRRSSRIKQIMVQSVDKEVQTCSTLEDLHKEEIGRLQYNWDLEKSAAHYFCKSLIRVFRESHNNSNSLICNLKTIIENETEKSSQLENLMAIFTKMKPEEFSECNTSEESG